MKAWLLEDIGGLDRLKLADTEEPKLAPGEVILDLEFAALNPADRYLAEGQYPAKPPMPHILGRDGVGIVRAVGSGVSNISVGQRLLILRGETGVTRRGTFAQRVAVNAESLVSQPPEWTVEQAACASLTYLTAHQALTMWGELPPSVVLITGASGGVGVATIQLARAMGHRVVALSRDAGKRRKLTDLGANLTIDPTDPHWTRILRDALSPKRVDLAIDNIGGAELTQVLETLSDLGKVSLVGRLAGPVPHFNTASTFFRRLRLGGVHVGAYAPAEARAAWELVLKQLAKNNARPVIDQVFAFDKLPAAFARLAAGPMGKVLLNCKN